MKVRTKVAEDVLRQWTALKVDDYRQSVDPLYLHMAASELLELREKVKQYEERGELQSKCECCGEILRDHEDEPGREWRYDAAGEVQLCVECIEGMAAAERLSVPLPGPDREPEGPTEEEPDISAVYWPCGTASPSRSQHLSEFLGSIDWSRPPKRVVFRMASSMGKSMDPVLVHPPRSLSGDGPGELVIRCEGSETVTACAPDWIPSVQAGPPPRDDEAAARAERMTEWATMALQCSMGKDCCDEHEWEAEDAWKFARAMETEREKALRGEGGGSDAS